MRNVTVGLLIVAAAIAYPAIAVLKLEGSSGYYQTFVWMLIAALAVPSLVMLALQFVKDSPRAVAATAAIAFVAFAGHLPFVALIIFLSALDFMNDGFRWGLLCLLAVLTITVGVICLRRYREEPAEGAGSIWSAPLSLSAAYVVLAYVALYSHIASKEAGRTLQ